MDPQPRGVGLPVFAWQESRLSPESGACDVVVPGVLLNSLPGRGVSFSEC